MNETIKQRWIEALLSGKYPQGTGQLRRTGVDGIDRWCCMGVLCDLAAQDGVGTWTPPGDNPMGHGTQRFVCRPALPSFGYGTAVMPSAVVRWAGLPDSNPGIASSGLPSMRSAGSVNDAGATFGEIAALIRDNL